jgi:hypothetical protein
MSGDIVELRKGDHSAERLQIERERLALEKGGGGKADEREAGRVTATTGDERASLWQTSQPGGVCAANARDLPAVTREKRKGRAYARGARGN